MRYTGSYSYNEKNEPFGFEVKKYEQNYIFGEGKDDGGAFSVEIKIKTSNFLTMKKIYHGAHTVPNLNSFFKWIHINIRYNIQLIETLNPNTQGELLRPMHQRRHRHHGLKRNLGNP